MARLSLAVLQKEIATLKAQRVDPPAPISRLERTNRRGWPA